MSSKGGTTSKKKRGEVSFELTEQDINERAKDTINNIIVEKVNLSAKNESQKKLLRSIKENQVTICNGLPGSGKTICAIYMALSMLKERNNFFQKILLVKSVTVLKNEELGFLKGDLNDKIEPYLESFKTNAKKLLFTTNVDDLFQTNIVRFLPLAYIRGINLDNAIVILDETQNVSVDNARTLMTRIGKNSKLICLGDANQIDIRDKSQSSLKPLLTMFDGEDDFGCIVMDENDENCRNPIIKKVEAKFKDYYESKGYKHG